jgi:hypothetical protein
MEQQFFLLYNLDSGFFIEVPDDSYRRCSEDGKKVWLYPTSFKILEQEKRRLKITFGLDDIRFYDDRVELSRALERGINVFVWVNKDVWNEHSECHTMKLLNRVKRHLNAKEGQNVKVTVDADFEVQYYFPKPDFREVTYLFSHNPVPKVENIMCLKLAYENFLKTEALRKMKRFLRDQKKKRFVSAEELMTKFGVSQEEVDKVIKRHYDPRNFEFLKNITLYEKRGVIGKGILFFTNDLVFWETPRIYRATYVFSKTTPLEDLVSVINTLSRTEIYKGEKAFKKEIGFIQRIIHGKGWRERILKLLEK